MKQAILNLKKKLLLVEFPTLEIREDVAVKSLIGKLTDIKEQQFGEWVFRSKIRTYKDYGHIGKKYDKFGLIDALLEMKFKTAKESFFSYLESQGIYFSNPLGKKPFVSVFDINPDSVVRKEYYKWEEAEQKVWNKNNCYVFQII